MSALPHRPSRAPIVEFHRTDVRIAGALILERIEWRLERGEHWGVVGPNGSGKTSLLGLVAGTVWPAPGSGKRVYDFGSGPQPDAVEARRRVSLVGHELQNRYARFGWNFRAVDVVLSGLTRTDIPQRRQSAAARARAERLLARFELAHLAGRRFLALSRGEQRRVLIARSVAFAPDVLLLDEPASGLDARARAELEAMLAALADSTTLVCAAHDESDLPAVVRHVAELEDGRIAHQGPRPPRPAEPAPGGDAAAAAPSVRAPAGRNLIEVRNASVYLEERAVLRDLSWTLRPRTQWLVTGPNGAGKSTFLRLLHGQVRPAVGGSIRWPALGDPRDVWTLRRRIGYVSAELQAAYRYPTSVRDCIASGFASSIGLTRRLGAAEDERVRALLAGFGLEALAARPLTTLSYGQMHRVLLARTLVNRPPVLLLDEPWEGLDRPTRDRVRAQLIAAMNSGTQIVCISHIAEPGLDFDAELRLNAGRATER